MDMCQKCHDDIAVANVSYPTMGSPLTKLDMCPVCTLRIIGRVDDGTLNIAVVVDFQTEVTEMHLSRAIAPLFQDALNGEQEPSVKWVAH